jgi:hypothetical protein
MIFHFDFSHSPLSLYLGRGAKFLAGNG